MYLFFMVMANRKDAIFQPHQSLVVIPLNPTRRVADGTDNASVRVRGVGEFGNQQDQTIHDLSRRRCRRWRT